MRVAITLSFDLLHSGHIDHLEEAHKLGDKVIIIIDPDQFLIDKKGYTLQPLSSRLRIAQFLVDNVDWIEQVIVSIDEDGTCAKTLRMLRPDVLAKGGDRTSDNMPENEIKACQEIGCKIVYGVGEQINSSSRLVREAFEAIERLPVMDNG